MNNMRIKQRLNLILCTVIALLMAFSFLLLTGFSAVKAEENIINYDPVTINDGQFNQKGSSIINYSPNWTGASVGFDEQVIAGVIDLSPSSVSKDDFLDTTGLDLYNEFKDAKPVTPFGKNEDLYPGTNTCVLMINTNNRTSTPRGTAYGFTSDIVNLQANSFYKFSAYVKTGSFAQNRGAVIKIGGFERDIGFWNIDTSDINVKTDELNGFRKYTIYVATAANSVSATVNLQVGDNYTHGEIGKDNYEEHITPSEGYAFFDNVTCTRLSANAFASEITLKNDRICIYDADLEADGIVKTKEPDGTLKSHREIVTGFDNGLNDLTKGFKAVSYTHLTLPTN